MNILIAPLPFKGTLSATEAALTLSRWMQKKYPDSQCSILPMADGGDGTLDLFLQSGAKERKFLLAHKECKWAELPSGQAVIELASVCGKEKKGAMKASSYALGQAIIAAFEEGKRQFLLTVGGSASTDLGTGMAQALGVKFLDAKGKEIEKGGGSLELIKDVDTSSMDPRVRESEWTVLCDVDSPLYGSEGAARVYAPQKGADSDQVERLEQGIIHLSQLLNLPNLGGAAGGVAAGARFFLGADLVSGSEWLLDWLDFDRILKEVDLVVTGEGCLDSQTVKGKGVATIIRRAWIHEIPSIAVVGKTKPGYEALFQQGLQEVLLIDNCN